CKGDVWLRLTFGIIDRISQAEIDRVVDSAVDVFLARYAA
ncbi:MAG TPA: TetR/AcrR family transcriptional regulator, partial [Sulfitobacter sp.]|nr:TetR/AcrR family transcriptional regulator [Sulfitobacter sp.]